MQKYEQCHIILYVVTEKLDAFYFFKYIYSKALFKKAAYAHTQIFPDPIYS